MKILITGATGFVGRNLVKELNKMSGTRLLIVSRDSVKSKEIFDDASILHCELTDRETITGFNPEIAIHLAAKLTSSNATEVIDDLIDSNIRYGVKLLDVLKDCPDFKLFINFGTFAEYLCGAEGINNAYLYSATKTAFRAFLDYYSDLGGFKYIHIAPYTIYGGESKQKKIIDLIKESLTAKEPKKMSGGEQILDFIHVDDVVGFIVFLLQKPMKTATLRNGETIYLGTGTGTSLRQLASKIETASGRKCNIAWGALPYRERDVMHAVAPIGKLIELGWKPTISLDDYIQRFSTK